MKKIWKFEFQDYIAFLVFIIIMRKFLQPLKFLMMELFKHYNKAQ